MEYLYYTRLSIDLGYVLPSKCRQHDEVPLTRLLFDIIGFRYQFAFYINL